MGEAIAAAGLRDWRKLGQGLHARYVVEDFGAAARLVTAIGEGGDPLRHHPRVRIGDGYVDLELVAPVWAALLTGDAAAQRRGTPGLTVLADQEGNRGVICADVSATGSG